MKTVLITGASRGIGRATALRLAEDGWHVYATVRNPADGEALAAEAKGTVTTFELDITDDAAVAAIGEHLPEKLDALINNAGIVVGGPVEGLTPERLRQQFDVNVVGTVGVTRAALPHVRAARGRILFLSSLSGLVSTTWTGAYNGSKFAIEGIADALRMEVKPWGINVVLIEPSNTATDMWGDAMEMFENTTSHLTEAQKELYKGHVAGMRKAVKELQDSAVPVAGVVDDIVKGLTAEKPRARYIVGIPNRAQIALAGVLPTRVLDKVLSKATGVPDEL